MSTTFEQDDPNGTIALCYELFGYDEAMEISARVPRPVIDPNVYRTGKDDDDYDSPIYLA